ncbi:MAG: apolipoprotein N-acyltransferase [Alphaproteobacteria bacterium]|nr:MAG: apolipoprotein N-acyltransferase [Alphaproteobacteria bacterium]
MTKLQGARAMGAGLVAGALAALALPPLYWLPLAVVGFVAFVWLWDGAPTARVAGLRAWMWGIGHFTVGSYWMVEAFFVPPADFAPLGPPAVVSLAIVLGAFPAAAAWGTKKLALRWPGLAGRYRRVVLLAIAWTAAEWLRGHIFTGYPWNPLGHVWAFATPLVQGAAWVGVYGLGTLSFVILAAPAAGWRAALAALAVVGLAGVAGQQVMPPIGAGSGPIIRIVQPNVPQAEKWRPESRARELQKLIDLSRREGFDRLAAVVWPETAVPFIVQPQSAGLPMLATAAPRGGYLLAGAPRAGPVVAEGVWNALVAITPGGEVAATYDKVHLVPFGEYIPFHKELPPLTGLIGRGSFEKGEAFTTIALPGLPGFSPLICYEAIFPADVTGPGARPAWLLNVTNDAWFGTSSGPYQHLVSARLRTVEEGLPMIRAANTGVSAVIDAFGRVLASLEMEREGVIDYALPPPRAATLYARWHDWTILAFLGILALFVVSARPKPQG